MQLARDERVMYDVSPRLFDKVAAFVVFLAVVAAGSLLYLPGQMQFLPVGFFVAIGLYDISKTASTNYVVTDRRILIESGVINKYTKTIPFRDINGVTVYSNFLSIGKGSIAVQTDSNTNVAYKALQPGSGDRIEGIHNYEEVGHYVSNHSSGRARA